MSKSGGKSGARGEGEKPEALSFEQAVERLEQIIAQIESGEIGLEKAVAEYERGVALIARCRSILEAAEQRVATLAVPAAPSSGASARRASPGAAQGLAPAPPDPDDDSSDEAPF